MYHHFAEGEIIVKKIILTGGGTSGHVTPNIALIPELKKQGFEIHYIATEDGMERKLIEKEGIPYHPISAGKLRRYLDIKNFTDTIKISKGFFQALSIINRLKPQVVFSKGGFVSCPVVWAAKLKGVPVIIHESDMTPGLANKLSIPFAKKVCYNFPETAKYLPKEKAVATGLPVRKSLLTGNVEKGREICGFSGDKPVIMVTGGSQGSVFLNNAVRGSLNELLKKYQVCHICGKGHIDEKYNNIRGYKQFEYVNEEQPHIFAMSDLVISRAGATSLYELLALKKPNILVPLSKSASRGDQILNAASFKKQGFSFVIVEEELNKDMFVENINKTYQNRHNYINAMSKISSMDGTSRVMDIIMENMKK
jgi:UDP-N-acetylglucosamine--N-acetylmuramyl-(pentapeptide) pyrophosphoryl-undecaprenol N-acetylglucosamine transferase